MEADSLFISDWDFIPKNHSPIIILFFSCYVFVFWDGSCCYQGGLELVDSNDPPTSHSFLSSWDYKHAPTNLITHSLHLDVEKELGMDLKKILQSLLFFSDGPLAIFCLLGISFILSFKKSFKEKKKKGSLFCKCVSPEPSILLYLSM